MLILLLLHLVYGVFPPPTLLRYTDQLVVGPQVYNIFLSHGDKNVIHTPKPNGDRLFLSAITPPTPMVLYTVNHGYIIKNDIFNDILCLNSDSIFRMLSYPSTTDLPNACILSIESVENHTKTNPPLTYSLINNTLCVNSSDIDIDTTFYISNNDNYLIVDENILSATPIKSLATNFTVKHTPCITSREKPEKNFLCRLENKRVDSCPTADKFVNKHNDWKNKIIQQINYKKPLLTVNNIPPPIWCPYINILCKNYSNVNRAIIPMTIFPSFYTLARFRAFL
jgi:hypothetical protein